jgi:serine O-acetyltransferase
MLLRNLRYDIDRYVYMSRRPALWCLLVRQGLWATVEYRASHWLMERVKIPVIRQACVLVCAVFHKIIEILTGIDMPPEAEIGKGLYISHFGGIIVSGDAKVGEYCNLSHGITIGIAGRAGKRGTPVIGDRVFVGPGAVVIGPISIGDDVAIGANAVVTKDLPPMAVAAGVPAQVISFRGSREFVRFRELDDG